MRARTRRKGESREAINTAAAFLTFPIFYILILDVTDVLNHKTLTEVMLKKEKKYCSPHHHHQHHVDHPQGSIKTLGNIVPYE